MKKFRLLSAFLVILSAISFTACSDEEPEMMENGGGGPAGPGVFRVNYNQDPANPRQFVVNGDEVGAVVTGNSAIAITATDEDTAEGFNISFIGNRLIHKDTLGPGYSAAITYTSGTGVYTNVNPATGERSGSVRLLAINIADKTISGEFSFRGWNSAGQEISFFNGRFENITYTGTLPEPGVEYFKAKVNGTLTEFTDITSPNTNGVRSLRGSIPTNSIMQFLYTANVTPTVGVFPLVDTPSEGIVGSYTMLTTATDYVSTSGTLKITEVMGGWVEGTFNYTGTAANGETVQITEGEFYIKLD